MTTTSFPIYALAFLAASLATLTSCTLAPPKSLIDVQAGEHFVLKQAVTLPAGKLRHYIQFGQLSGGHFSSYDQHCRLELYTLTEKSTTINPQRFLIDRVATDEEMIAQADWSIHFTDNSANRAFMAVQNDAPPLSNVVFAENQRPETMDLVHLYLTSDSQPNVYRLTCAGSLSNGALQDAPQSYRPQREQINRILGRVGEVQP